MLCNTCCAHAMHLMHCMQYEATCPMQVMSRMVHALECQLCPGVGSQLPTALPVRAAQSLPPSQRGALVSGAVSSIQGAVSSIQGALALPRCPSVQRAACSAVEQAKGPKPAALPYISCAKRPLQVCQVNLALVHAISAVHTVFQVHVPLQMRVHVCAARTDICCNVVIGQKNCA